METHGVHRAVDLLDVGAMALWSGQHPNSLRRSARAGRLVHGIRAVKRDGQWTWDVSGYFADDQPDGIRSNFLADGAL